MIKNEPNLASEQCIEIIENQIAANNPPKVRKNTGPT